MGYAEHAPRYENLPAFVRHWATVNPDGLALRHREDVLTYAQLDRKVDALVCALRGRGLGHGDTAMLIGVNTVPWVAAFLACLRLGVIVAPTNNRISASQLREQATLLNAELVMHDAEHRSAAEAVLEVGTGTVDLFDLYSEESPTSNQLVSSGPEAADSALVSFTSGTTGTPKGAVISHGALAGMSQLFAEYFGSDTSDSTLVMVPLFHNTGFVDQFGHMLAAGGCTSLLSRYSTTAAIAELGTHPVSFLAAVPSMVRMLMIAEGADQVFANLQTIMYGGSPMPGPWSAELLERFPHLRLVHAYGLSEFTSVCTFLPGHLVVEKGESVGLPLPGVEVRVVDEGGTPVATGEQGEVWISGATIMSGYWRRPDLTADKLQGPWLRTGDIGHLDDDGLLWLAGRLDDVINRGGEKILPTYVESCIAQLTDIADATVFGYSDPVLQQRVAAAVQIRPGGNFDEGAVRSHLATLLPDYAVPERWLVYESLPLTASGKVDRKSVAGDLADSLQAGQ